MATHAASERGRFCRSFQLPDGIFVSFFSFLLSLHCPCGRTLDAINEAVSNQSWIVLLISSRDKPRSVLFGNDDLKRVEEESMTDSFVAAHDERIAELGEKVDGIRNVVVQIQVRFCSSGVV